MGAWWSSTAAYEDSSHETDSSCVGEIINSGVTTASTIFNAADGWASKLDSLMPDGLPV